MVSYVAAVLIVTMFAVSGVMHLGKVLHCDQNILAKFMGRKPCDWLAASLLSIAGVLELVSAVTVALSYTTMVSSNTGLTMRKYAALYLMCFTALVTAMFKAPRLLTDKPLSAKLIPILSNITTFGALLAIYESA